MFFTAKKRKNGTLEQGKAFDIFNQILVLFMGRITKKLGIIREMRPLGARMDKNRACTPCANNSFVLQCRHFRFIISL